MMRYALPLLLAPGLAFGQAAPPPCPALTPFTVTSSGFTDPYGQPWTMQGVNAGVQDVLGAYPAILQRYPGMTAVRLFVFPGQDTTDNIAQAAMLLNGAGVATEIEDHSGNQTNAAFYQQMASMFGDDPYVFLGTPNEPGGGAANVIANQIMIVNTIRAAGFNNPVSLQFDYSCGECADNLGPVTAAVGTTQMYAAPHIYGSAWQMQAAQAARSVGLFTVANEFGNGTNGYTMDGGGNQVIASVIRSVQSGAIGAVFWAINNGNHGGPGVDSACTDPSCTALTPTGQLLVPWLSGSVTPNTQSIATSCLTAPAKEVAPAATVSQVTTTNPAPNPAEASDTSSPSPRPAEAASSPAPDLFTPPPPHHHHRRWHHRRHEETTSDGDSDDD